MVPVPPLLPLLPLLPLPPLPQPAARRERTNGAIAPNQKPLLNVFNVCMGVVHPSVRASFMEIQPQVPLGARKFNATRMKVCQSVIRRSDANEDLRQQGNLLS